MTTKTRRKRQQRDVLCEVCGQTFQASAPNAKTCSPTCRLTSMKMRRRMLVLAPLGIEVALGYTETGEPTIISKVPISAWPAIEAAADVEGVGPLTYVDGWMAFARARMMRRVAADQEEAQSHA